MTAVSIETIQPDPAVIFDDATAALDEDFDDDTDFTGDDDDIDDVPAQRGRSREPSYIDLRDAAVLRMAPDLPADQAGLDTVAREAFEAFHAAVVIGDEAAMMAASIRYDAVVWKLNGGAFFACEAGNEAVSPRLRARLAAAPGAVPLWGQSGEFLVDHAGIRAIVIARGGPSSLQVEFRAVSATGPFISNTGQSPWMKDCPDAVMPLRRTFTAWGKVTGLAGAGKTESHGNQRNLVRIVERSVGYAHPFAQALTAGIVPWHPAFMRQTARCLTGDDNPGAIRNRHQRAGRIWEMRLAYPAGQDFPAKPSDFNCHDCPQSYV